MDTLQVIETLRTGIFVALRIAGPLLLCGMAVGVLVAIFQAVTQIHEQTISFALKLTVVVSICLFAGEWMLETLVDFGQQIFALMVST